MVVASNFAPGTTAADIESVMQPIGGNMAGCRLVASSPTVIAEMVFLERAGADNVIAMFNNKRVSLTRILSRAGTGDTPAADTRIHRPMAEYSTST